MSSVNNINNNNYVVNVGRTTPVDPGPQPASKSIPVVVSTDQEAVPVVEQNKILSEVSLSLLGIPRAEVALGIFADVNTYDVNPSEWSSSPEQRISVAADEATAYTDIPGKQTTGVSHLPEESGALVEAGADEVAVLTSKRFFRYQPGRVSAATFGIKSTTSVGALSTSRKPVRNPTIKKYGIFDKFDGYYWETRDTAQGDQFAVVRRTQSIIRSNPLEYGNGQLDDHALVGKPPARTNNTVLLLTAASKLISKNRFTYMNTVVTAGDANQSYYDSLSPVLQEKCKRDMDLAMDAYIADLQYGGNGHTIANATTYRTANNLDRGDEVAVHSGLKELIKTELTTAGETIAAAKIETLSAIQTGAVGGTELTQLEIDAAQYGSRSKVDTVFEVYRKYLGYLVSASQTYDTSVTDEKTLKYKCLRDVKFALDAYSGDISSNGNAATIYNAKRYYFGGSIKVYTQQESNGVQKEIARHTYLKHLLTGNPALVDTTTVEVEVNDAGTGQPIVSVVDLFGLTGYKDKLVQLCDLTIANFTEQYQGGIEYGDNEVFGDVTILRDGLIMTHAALYDPSLLKKKERQVVEISVADSTLTLEKGNMTIGQYVNYYGTCPELTDGKTYYVKSVDGHKSNVITLADPLTPTVAITLSTLGSGVHEVETPVPFLFPDDYDVDFTNPNLGGGTKYDGMFPYMYSDTGVLPLGAGGEGVTSKGRIDTAIDTTANYTTLRNQIDAINLEYVGWIRDHVDPKYWSVYEYRVPRSRFSGDSLDGPFEEDGETAKTRNAVYSDNVSGNKAGESYVVNDEQVVQQSVWDYDFSKVTMLKIEFSWYGAVGALFLAYVPVGNGEARWVRVHHLRCSNQLKISSLGNATLPITYLVYGGGSENRLGIANDERANHGYASSYSENLVKYGASYYIDGGDRGTVRLYNHSSVDPAKGNVQGSKHVFTVDDTHVVPGTPTASTRATTNPYFKVDSTNGSPALSTFYIGAKIITGDPSDQDIEIIWVDTVNNYVYIDKVTSGSPSSIDVVVDRTKMLYGLKTKAAITSGDGNEVRNRVQVYPTKLSIGTIGANSGKLTLLKTPLFQTNTGVNGTFTTDATVDIMSSNLLSTTDTNYLSEEGDFVYGYFKGYLNNASAFIKVLGKIERKNDLYYFYPHEVFSGQLQIVSGSEFVRDEIFDSEGNIVSHNINDFSKERLSSVFVSNTVQSPIPGTGTSVATYYVSAGSADYDLSAYFDYNKEYISFPLTDSLETLYLSLQCQESYTGTELLNVAASLTWEEQ